MIIIRTKGKFQIWSRASELEFVAVSGLFKTRGAAEKRLASMERGTHDHG